MIVSFIFPPDFIPHRTKSIQAVPMELHEKIIFYFLGRQSQIQLRQPTVNLSHCTDPPFTVHCKTFAGIKEYGHSLGNIITGIMLLFIKISFHIMML